MGSEEGLNGPLQEVLVHGHKIDIQIVTGSNVPVCSFLGPNGTFSEQAAKQLLVDQVIFQEQSSNSQVVETAGMGGADLAVVAVENSSDSFVNEATRKLFESPNLSVLAEEILPIEQTLFGRPDASAVLRSHEKAIGQCRGWIARNLPGVQIITHPSTSEAIAMAAKNNEMAIGCAVAADLYAIPIIQEGIEDIKGNATRFWLLGRGETQPTGEDATATFFSLPDIPGSLSEAFACFGKRGINISAPTLFPTGSLDQYIFLTTFDGHAKDEEVMWALRELEDICFKVRVLGSYKKIKPIRAYSRSLVQEGWLGQ